ncbi:S-(hydroxymethyl)glutathione dehydrogenase / alcohol dehydrogenase [Amycolatopsis sacchari]|uniref:S-(Hydroxymethyl)glutathione dehydrogenase / alcohol dehydrogenase n=1 Tax=Amycolatopsis sacchari TaxID=115433 RepID=A0A1I3L308_9PSEU|nr:NDMA-dependent alcohol dehydrogenase [Amycolatopsis sacchari]SFI79081.1 S-(hydroxymethyl)glutathione dehydrogenase / alcohol dehydrogenase [Amycolatopsis sacchari]
MRTRAAVLWEARTDWKVETIDLDPPRAGEVLVRIVAAGMCHSEDHHATGDVPFTAPMIGGHEGAGVVEETGPGVTSVAPGDHVVFSSLPSCGRCPSCSVGRHNLCDLVMHIGAGRQLSDHTARHHLGGEDLAINCFLGAFAEHTVVNEMSLIKVDSSLPLEKLCVLSCGVPTGWGSAVYAGEAKLGDDVAVVGVGGLGSAAVQGARNAGARRIFAIDPVEWKREKALGFGATHTAAGVAEAFDVIQDVTWGRMCDVVVLTMGVGRGGLMADVMRLAAKRGRVVVTNIHPADEIDVRLSMNDLIQMEKRIVGAIFGSVNARRDIPALIESYRDGRLDLDGMITREYPLDEINQGYRDLRAGRNIRGVLRMG